MSITVATQTHKDLNAIVISGILDVKMKEYGNQARPRAVPCSNKLTSSIHGNF
jgi:hypothetical protein